MHRIRKMKNISSASIPVNVGVNTVIYLSPTQVLENRDVFNLEEIREFVQVELDLSEVIPVEEGKQYLKG